MPFALAAYLNVFTRRSVVSKHNHCRRERLMLLPVKVSGIIKGFCAITEVTVSVIIIVGRSMAFLIVIYISDYSC